MDLVVAALVEFAPDHQPRIVDADEHDATIRVAEGHERFLKFCNADAGLELDGVALTLYQALELICLVPRLDLDHEEEYATL